MQYLGLISYERGLQFQTDALAELQRGKTCRIFGLEHEPVITLGVRGDVDQDLSHTVAELRAMGIGLHFTARGGQATLHSPGQLVIYPCINLRAYGLGPREYVELVQDATRGWLQEKGIESAKGLTEPGLFVDGKKLVAFGFKISRGLTSHGLAINVRNDLKLFRKIRTCGVDSQSLTSLQQLGVSISHDLEALFLSWGQHFKRTLGEPRDTILTTEHGPR